MKPATPLPWRRDGEDLKAMVRGDDATIVAVRHRLPSVINQPNMAYIVHSANAYPRLVEFVKHVSRLSSVVPYQLAEELLRDLGELK